MALDEVIRSAISRLGVVRVSNALNTLLYMSLVVVPLSWTFAWLFGDDPILKYLFVGFGAVYASAFLAHYTRFALKSPDRLQSEEHLARMQELAIIERKGAQGPTISPALPGDGPVSEQDLFTQNDGEGKR